MSDFLNNFNKEKYEHTLSEKKQAAEGDIEQKNDEAVQTKKVPFSSEPSFSKVEQEPFTHREEWDQIIEETQEPISQSRSEKKEEATEIDPDYQKKQKKKQVLILTGAIVLVVSMLVVYYFMSHIPMPNLTGKPLSEARKWAVENKMQLDIKQEFSNKVETNEIISQEKKKGVQVKKGSKITVVSSKGADPDEKLTLPDFSKMSESAATQWIKDNKAENISVIAEYNDSIEKGKYIKQEITDPEVNEKNYARKDKAIVYYSKGKETFKKDISVPDFVGKAKSEVETWAKKNDIQMTYEEVDSADTDNGYIVSQNIAKNEKIAKKEAMQVQVSLGKATVVPDFANLSKEQAATVTGLNVIVKEQFSNTVGYGQLLNQSVGAGHKITQKDDNQVEVVYSSGKPYLKNLCDENVTEGDLQKLFYEEYISKGANIRYTTYYVDSAEPKGKVVKMSAMSQYIPTDFTVSIGISRGNLVGEPSQTSKQTTNELPED